MNNVDEMAPDVSAEDRSHVIVVGVDGSPSSLRALEWAVHQAELSSCSLEVISTWEWPLGYGYAVIPQDYQPEDDLDKLLAPVLESLKDAHPSVHVHHKIVEGHPAQVLVEASRGASLLVVGRRGRGGLTDLLTGSTSKQCVTDAHCPVVIREPRD